MRWLHAHSKRALHTQAHSAEGPWWPSAAEGRAGRGNQCGPGPETRHPRQLSTKDILCVGTHKHRKGTHTFTCKLVSLEGCWACFDADTYTLGTCVPQGTQVCMWCG